MTATVQVMENRKVAKQKKKSPFIRVRYGGWAQIINADTGKVIRLVNSLGRQFDYLNQDVPMKDGKPKHPLHTALCEVCEYCYSELMGSGTCQCAECGLEKKGKRGQEFEDETGEKYGWYAQPLWEKRSALSRADMWAMHSIRRR